MKLSEAKQYLPFVQAAAEGKTIQAWSDTFKCYHDVSPDAYFTNICESNPALLRIKPTAKLRPWKSVDEVPIGKIIRNKKSGNRGMITAAACDGTSYCFDNWSAFENTFETCVMDDGSPYGILE